MKNLYLKIHSNFYLDHFNIFCYTFYIFYSGIHAFFFLYLSIDAFQMSDSFLKVITFICVILLTINCMKYCAYFCVVVEEA